MRTTLPTLTPCVRWVTSLLTPLLLTWVLPVLVASPPYPLTHLLLLASLVRLLPPSLPAAMAALSLAPGVADAVVVRKRAHPSGNCPFFRTQNALLLQQTIIARLGLIERVVVGLPESQL
jgi:hypothetical protein